MLNSYSVIVPVHNKHGDIGRTLESITAAMSFFDRHHPEAGRVSGEVVVVDEASTDGTLEIVQALAQSDSRVRVVRHNRTFGIGAARNAGGRAASGDVLFFCDGDDLFFPEHVFVGFSVLDRATREESTQATAFVPGRGHIDIPPNQTFSALRTGIYLRDEVHPDWKTIIQNTMAQNVCVRRECHDWLEGFPQEFVYKRIGGCEDGAYAVLLSTFFRVAELSMETVEYRRSPGNSFDLQLTRFRNPPRPRDRSTPDLEAAHRVRQAREEQTIGYLLDKWLMPCLPPLPPTSLNWESVVRELVARRRLDDAQRVVDDARRHGQHIAVPHVTAAETRPPERNAE